MKNKNIAYDVITQRIIDQLEKGVIPWRKPWISSYPKNMKSDKRYNGVNLLHLWCLDFECNVFGTYKQIKEAGGNVKKGEKGFPVVFYNVVQIKDKETLEIKPVPFLKYYTVFNLEQTEGIEIPNNENDNEEIIGCENVVNNMKNKPEIVHGNYEASYYPRQDTIKLHNKNKFHSSEEYYSTLFHELTHSTGHRNRLNRPSIQDIHYGSEKYSKEELIAEIGAAFLCAKTGIENNRTLENTASYVNGWMIRIKKDNRLIVQAASNAQKAVDYIIGD